MSITFGYIAGARLAVAYLERAKRRREIALGRLSSGDKMFGPCDAGGTAVAMKMDVSMAMRAATSKNLENAASFLRVQESALHAIGNGISRLMELKVMSLDVSKCPADENLYLREADEVYRQIASRS